MRGEEQVESDTQRATPESLQRHSRSTHGSRVGRVSGGGGGLRARSRSRGVEALGRRAGLDGLLRVVVDGTGRVDDLDGHRGARGNVDGPGELGGALLSKVLAGSASQQNGRRGRSPRVAVARGEIQYLQSGTSGVTTGDDGDVVGGDTTGPREEDGLALERV